MNDIEIQIKKLLQTKGKSAAQITESLKKIGKGNMEDGINKIAEYYLKEGNIAGAKRGVVRGAVGGIAIISIVHLVSKIVKDIIEKKKDSETEAVAIVKAFEKEVSVDGNNVKGMPVSDEKRQGL